MSKPSQLKTQISHLQSWLITDALPFWSTQGINPHNGAVYEQLLFDGKPDLTVNQRLRVQARQILVFCVAQQQQWIEDSQPLVNKISQFMQTYGRISTNHAGYAQMLNAQNQIITDKLDTYDFAFYLLSCFHRWHTFKEQSALDEANRLLAYMEVHFKDGSAGWLEGNYQVTHRRQNPHMHLFEAFMTGYEVTGDGRWLAKAGQIFSLFEQFFFNPSKQVLYEHFDSNWQLAIGASNRTIEPGHMFEWVWLLRWYERLTHTPTSLYCDGLYNKAMQIGFDPISQLIYDGVDEDGKVISASKRCWPLTEFIKASLAQASVSTLLERPVFEENAALGIQLLFDFYMHPEIAGSYIDQLDGNNKVLANHAPASTLYHLVVAGIDASKYQQKYL
jgi:mannose/cellobiose epimerase-like protein (N-acyl-D-glucosamine 2-epimerase family)